MPKYQVDFATAVRCKFIGGNYAGEVNEAYSQAVTTYYDFRATDTKGRAIGAYVTTFRIQYIALAEGEDPGEWGAVQDQPGIYYGYVPQAARNRESYGAIKPYVWFTTAEERDAAIIQYVKAAHQRARKNADSYRTGAPVVEEVRE